MRTQNLFPSSLLFLATLLGVTGPGRAQCLEWKPGFEVPGPTSLVSPVGMFEDGSGPAFYALGSSSFDGVSINGIAKWDGSTWSALGSGLGGQGYALIGFNDGTGPALYVGGFFTTAGSVSASNIARWDGAAWSALGAGTDSTVSALVVFDDGTGPALYAGGDFTTAGGTPADHIAKWDGSSWSPVGTGVGTGVSALAVFDDGTGSALYAGGSSVYRWNGSTWSPVGTGLDGGAGILLVFDDGTGPALYAVGNGVFKWDGSAWSPLGTDAPNPVSSLVGFDDGSGPALFALSDRTIWRWDGFSWSYLQVSGWQAIVMNSLAVLDDSSGSTLVVGGIPWPFDNLPLFLARRSGSNWIPVGSSNGMNDGVTSLTVIGHGSGAAMYAGGYFHAAGGTAASHIARFDGLHWSALGGGVEGGLQPYQTSVNAVVEFDDGTGLAIYAGGAFSTAGGTPANNIARWDGSIWTPLGGGLDGPVTAMCVFDDGTGAALYVGGNFSTAGGVSVGGIAKWDGSTWSPVGSGLGGGARALLVFDDGTGPALYAGGNGISKWDGSTWSRLGSDAIYGVTAFAVFDDGTGPALCAAGVFPGFAQCAGGGIVTLVAKWNGSCWSSLGAGLSSIDLCPSALTAFDDGYGPALYVSVSYSCFLNPAVYKWKGANWSDAIDVYTDKTDVTSMVAFQSPSDSGPGLYLGISGPAAWQGAIFSGIAELRGCNYPIIPLCFGDGTGSACPCDNTGLPGHGCNNSIGTGGAVLSATGTARLTHDTIHLTASSERPTAFSLFLQGDTEIPPRVFGDGVGCMGSPLKRLFSHNAVGGSVTAPQDGDLSLSARSAAVGDPITPGAIRVYQVFYRDPDPHFCPEPVGATFNTTNGLRVLWGG